MIKDIMKINELLPLLFNLDKEKVYRVEIEPKSKEECLRILEEYEANSRI